MTLNRTRATCAKICVKVDLTMEPMKGFPIVVSPSKCIWQETRYEKLGFYCNKCYRQGYMAIVCRVGENQKAEGKKERTNQNLGAKNKTKNRGISNSKEG